MRLLQPLGKNSEAPLRHGLDQGLAILEVAVGRGRADINEPRGFDQREALGTPFRDQKSRGIDQTLAQISVVIASPSRLRTRCEWI